MIQQKERTKTMRSLTREERSFWRYIGISLVLLTTAFYSKQMTGQDTCSEGHVADCSDDGDCCPENYIEDGWADCADFKSVC